ncbi:unnamed protein product [Dicrocoelium dendriticum]|nr:unnamed protein product [Dicrocoelium dendriticum]
MKSPLTLDLKQICTWRYSKDTQEQSTEQNCTPSTMDNASSDIQACSIVGVLHSFSPFTCAAEQPRDLTILPLTKSNLIRHTRMQKWVHHYQILQQQLNDSRSEDQYDSCHLTEGTHQKSEARPEAFFHMENLQHRLEHPKIVLASEESGWVDLFKPDVCDMGQKKRENNVNFSYVYAQNYGQRTNANSVKKLGSEAMKIPAEYTLTNHPHLSTCGFTLNHPPSPNFYSKRTHRQAFGSYNSVGAVCVADKAVNTGPQLWPTGWVENPKIVAGCTGGRHMCNTLPAPCPCRRRGCSSGASYAHTSANELNISSCYNCQHGNYAVRMSHPCPTYGSSMNYHPQCHPLSNEMLLLPVGDVHAYNSGSNATGTYHSTLLQSGVNGSMGLAYVPENRGPHTWRESVCTRCRDVHEIPLCCHMNEHNTIQGRIPAQPTHGPPMNSFSYAMSNWCNSQKQPTLYALDPTQPQLNRQAQCTAPNMKIIPRETMEGGVCSKHIQPPAFSSMTKSIVFSAASAMAMCGLETNTRQPLSRGIQQTVATEPAEQLVAPNSVQAQIKQGAVVPELPFRLHMVANGKSTTVQPISVAAATNVSARAMVGLNSLATLTQHQAVEIKGSNNSRESCQAVGQNYYNLILRCKNDQKTCSSSVAATTSSAIRCRPMNNIGPGSTWFGMAERSAIELSATG